MGRYIVSDEDICGWEDFDLADIQDCSDVAQLESWYCACEAKLEDMRAQLLAYRLAGEEDPSWVRRVATAMGFYGVGQTRLRQKMRALGTDPNPLGTRIDELNKKHQITKAEAAYGKCFMEAAEARLTDEDLLYIRRDANQRLDALAGRKVAA